MANQTTEQSNKALVSAAFERWRNGTGSPFDLLHPDVEWTIVGSSPLSKTYYGKQQFFDLVVSPFNARLASPAVPTVHGIYADGDMVIIRYDAEALAIDGIPYLNTYTWYLQMKDKQAVKGIAFFDTRYYDALWTRITL
jgi:ketosteroid isomerase-like protein